METANTKGEKSAETVQCLLKVEKGTLARGHGVISYRFVESNLYFSVTLKRLG